MLVTAPMSHSASTCRRGAAGLGGDAAAAGGRLDTCFGLLCGFGDWEGFCFALAGGCGDCEGLPNGDWDLPASAHACVTLDTDVSQLTASDPAGP